MNDSVEIKRAYRRLYQTGCHPLDNGTYKLLNFECHFNHRPPIVCPRPNASGWMIMSEAERIIQMTNILGPSINLSGTFELQDPGVMLIEEDTSRNDRLSKIICDGYYKWDGQYLKLHVGRRSATTEANQGVRYVRVMKSVWDRLC